LHVETINRCLISRTIEGLDMKNDRKPKEEKFEASEQDFRSLFEHVGCGVYISSKEGKLLTVNQTLVDMLGYDSKTEFLAIDITHDLYHRPEDRRKFQEMIGREGRVVDYEEVYKRKDGSLIPILLTSTCGMIQPETF
jgi:two-component system NtrC family sensor kinase